MGKPDALPDLDDAVESGHTRAAEIADEVVARIVRLEHAPGSVITEGEITRDYDTSKPTAREALQRVMFQGLVTPRQGSGYLVHPVTLREARDLLDWWCVMLESCAERLSSRGLPENWGESSVQVAQGVGTHNPDGPPSEVVRDFSIVLLLQNASFLKAAISQWHEMTRLEVLANRGNRVVAEPAIEDVLEAVRGRDAGRARELMRARTRDFELKVLDALISLSAVQDRNLAEPPD